MNPALIGLSLASSVCFGVALVLTQAGLRHLPPLRGAATSLPSTAVLFLALSPFALPGAGWHGPSALLFALVGLLYPLGVTLLIFGSNFRIGPELTGTLGNLAPLFAVLLAWALLGEVPRAGQFLAMLVIVFGMTLLVGGPSGRSGTPLWCFALPLAAAVLRGLAQPVVKLGLATWPSPFAATLLAYLVSATLLLGVIMPRQRRTGLALSGSSRRGHLWFCAVGVANGMAQLLLFTALSRGPVAVVAPVVASSPLVTLALSQLLSGRRPMSRTAVVGAVLSVLGIMLLLAA